MSNKPHNIKSAASLGLDLACWTNEEGKISFSVSKRYKDKNSGEWKDTKYLTASDLAGLVELAHKGLEWAGKIYDSRRSSGGGQTERTRAEVVASATLPPSGGKSLQQQVPFDEDDIPF